MGLGRLVEAWSKYEIQTLVLLSLLLQLLLFILPILRRHKMLEKRARLATLFKLLLWLAYQLADTTAVYVLGHMAFSSSTPSSGEVMALWASILLVHLGGQDTVTAYSLEDNRLWKRHLLTLGVQAAGVAYVLSEHIGGGIGGRRSSGWHPRLRDASTLMFVVGFLKFVERILVLRWSSDMIKVARTCIAYLDDRQQDYAPREQDSSSARAEKDLTQAHGLLMFCLWHQFVDDNDVSLSQYQKSFIKATTEKKRLFELVHLQLSLMHDLLYTKAAAIHTWHGCLIRVFSWVVTVITCTLVFLSGSIIYGSRRLDAAVTYALLAGAFLLETASSLKAAGSTWTCETLRRSRGWGGLRRVVLGCRRLVRAAEWSRRWPGYIGGWRHFCCIPDGSWSAFGQKDPDTSLVVEQIEEMVTQYMMGRAVDHKEKEKLMNNSRGGLSLDRLQLSSTLKVTLEQLQFDEYLVIWYHASLKFFGKHDYSFSLRSERLGRLQCGAQQLSTYMLYLFDKQPHMLPPPLRKTTHGNLAEEGKAEKNVLQNLVTELELSFNGTRERERMFKAILWVWVEMLCYAASNCNRESHARELSNGSPEFATVLWVLRAVLFNANVPDPSSEPITADPSSSEPITADPSSSELRTIDV